LVIFSHCKLNLGLQILSRRTDGFHNIFTCFYPVPWHDVIEMVQADEFSFTMSGLPVAGDPSSNLCVKAWQIVQSRYQLPPVQLHLHKVVPMGAGLGGGSSNAAATIQLAERKFGLSIPMNEKLDIAASLGSDCAYFLLDSPAFGSGRGEILEPCSIDLAGYKILVVHPGIHVNTAWAFRSIDHLPYGEDFDLRSALKAPVEQWRHLLFNNFEPLVFPLHFEIASIKQTLYESGAVYASMSGSGSAVFGIFNLNDSLPTKSFRSYNTFVF
jgi:4-diphosphocytidyl-2-C-methyl-D-erythritol kinase